MTQDCHRSIPAPHRAASLSIRSSRAVQRVVPLAQTSLQVLADSLTPSLAVPTTGGRTAAVRTKIEAETPTQQVENLQMGTAARVGVQRDRVRTRTTGTPTTGKVPLASIHLVVSIRAQAMGSLLGLKELGSQQVTMANGPRLVTAQVSRDIAVPTQSRSPILLRTLRAEVHVHRMERRINRQRTVQRNRSRSRPSHRGGGLSVKRRVACR